MKNMTLDQKKEAVLTEWKRLCAKFPELAYMKFEWGRGILRRGVCTYPKSFRHISPEDRDLRKVTVRVSAGKAMEGCPIEMLLDVVRHEAAHALDVAERGYSDHGWRWKQQCKLTGANPEQFYEGEDRVKPKFEMFCQLTGRRVATFHRNTPRIQRHREQQSVKCDCHRLPVRLVEN